MTGLPERSEAAEAYFTYIDKIGDPDVVARLDTQFGETLALLRGISEEQSLHRYAPGKWSMRELLSHINDSERVFVFRAFWFARGFEGELPSFDQDIGAAAAKANDYSWAHHVEEFAAIRPSTLTLFRSLPAEAWKKTGVASGHEISVRALAYVVAGHVEHHVSILKERYL